MPDMSRTSFFHAHNRYPSSLPIRDFQGTVFLERGSPRGSAPWE